jgi:hypothetical protein
MCTIANINARIAANPELERKKRLSRYQVNPEIAKKASKKWRLANLDKDKANKFNYHKKQMQVNMQPLWQKDHELKTVEDLNGT